MSVLIVGGWLGAAGRSAHPDKTGDAAPPVHALGQGMFAAYRGEPFHVEGMAGESLDMRLIDVIDYRPRTGQHHDGESFALVFRGAGDRALAQETYQFSHPSLGTFPLFIVPGLAGADGVSHEAIINRVPVY